jgi:hypothetical protein
MAASCHILGGAGGPGAVVGLRDADDRFRDKRPFGRRTSVIALMRGRPSIDR